MEEAIAEFKSKARLARRLGDILQLTGYIGLLCSLIFTAAGMRLPATISLFWFAGHLIGYFTKCFYQEASTLQKYIAAAEKSMQQSKASQQHTVRLHNRIGLN